MTILSPTGWDDWELLDSGNGQKLERFGKFLLIRPDPQIIWKPRLPQSQWDKADAVFERTVEDKGVWKKNPPVGGPEGWIVSYNNLSFYIKLTPFKHTGVFPEQSVHWEFIKKTIEGRESKVGVEDGKLKIENQFSTLHPQQSTVHLPSSPVNILNLFGYTGGATLAAAAAGAKVTHVDASYPTIGWAKENQKLSNLEDKPIRWMLDDCLKFCQRELRRGVKYDGIIMDPPVYGHGPEGETWKFNTSLPKLIEVCKQLLSDNPLFVIINAYAVSTSAVTLENVLKGLLEGKGGTIETGELALKESGEGGRLLSTGIFSRWSNSKV